MYFCYTIHIIFHKTERRNFREKYKQIALFNFKII